MSYTGNVPVRGWRTTLYATDLRSDAQRQDQGDLLDQESWLAGGTKVTEAWFVALHRARRAFGKQHRQRPRQLVFTPAEAARVSRLPQMRHHRAIWREKVGRHAILPCGLPTTLQGMEVVVLG